MIIEYFVLKITLETLLQECNKLAISQEVHERANQLKARLFQLRMDYENGAIDKERYSKQEGEILGELGTLGQRIKNYTMGREGQTDVAL